MIERERCISCEMQSEILEMGMIIQDESKPIEERRKAQLRIIFLSDQLDAVGWGCKFHGER